MMARSNKHKFGNLILRSKFETNIAQQILDADLTFEYEIEQFEYWVKQQSCVCAECGNTEIYKRQWYMPDFFMSNGIIIEAKGYFTAADRKKALGMKEYHPNIDIRLVFQSNNKINRKSEVRYSDWCDRHGIKYAIKRIPTEWLTK